MFTGLIQTLGVVRGMGPVAAGVRLEIEPGAWSHRAAAGDSVAVNGCCLTVVDEPEADGRLRFDVVPETLAKTTLGGLKPGATVNLEHAATMATLLGGHVVQGHVDGVAVVERVETDVEWRVRVRPGAELMEYMTPKGSVTVEGVSLTLAAVEPGTGSSGGWFEVALIPTTLEKTTLKELRPGDRCNVECDAMAKTVVHWIRHYGAKR